MAMDPKMRALAAAMAVALAAGSTDAATLYATDSERDQLLSIDTTTAAVSVVGSLGTNVSFEGLAYDGTSGTMYMSGGRNNNNLYTLDLGTGAATLVGAHGIRDLFGLAYDTRNGVLYGSQFSGGTGLYSLSTSTGAATTINAGMTEGIGGLAYDYGADRLLGVHPGSGELYQLDRATGAQTLLASTDFINDMGAAYDPDTGLVWAADYSGSIFTYDPVGGTRSTVATGTGYRFSGLTFAAEIAAVPLPGTLPLMAAGLALAGAAGLRRQRRTARR